MPDKPLEAKEYKRMKRVQVTEDNLTKPQMDYIAQQTKIRYDKYAHLTARRRNLFALGLGGVVIAIYAFTIRQMSKDRLCDEIDREVQSKLQR